jgi:hypothetical protein
VNFFLARPLSFERLLGLLDAIDREAPAGE